MVNHPNRSQAKDYPFAVMLNGGLNKAFKGEAAAREYLDEQKEAWGFDKAMKFELVDRSAA